MHSLEHSTPVVTVKESFSGPSDIIGAAKEAAAAKFKNRKGGWSAWIVEAISERLTREGKMPEDARAELAAAAEEVGGTKRALEILQRANRPIRTLRKRPALRKAA